MPTVSTTAGSPPDVRGSRRGLIVVQLSFTELLYGMGSHPRLNNLTAGDTLPRKNPLPARCAITTSARLKCVEIAWPPLNILSDGRVMVLFFDAKNNMCYVRWRFPYAHHYPVFFLLDPGFWHEVLVELERPHFDFHPGVAHVHAVPYELA